MQWWLGKTFACLFLPWFFFRFFPTSLHTHTPTPPHHQKKIQSCNVHREHLCCTESTRCFTFQCSLFCLHVPTVYTFVYFFEGEEMGMGYTVITQMINGCIKMIISLGFLIMNVNLSKTYRYIYILIFDTSKIYLIKSKQFLLNEFFI